LSNIGCCQPKRRQCDDLFVPMGPVNMKGRTDIGRVGVRDPKLPRSWHASIEENSSVWPLRPPVTRFDYRDECVAGSVLVPPWPGCLIARTPNQVLLSRVTTRLCRRRASDGVAYRNVPPTTRTCAARGWTPGSMPQRVTPRHKPQGHGLDGWAISSRRRSRRLMPASPARRRNRRGGNDRTAVGRFVTRKSFKGEIIR
jgi:hypothetical protein